MKIAQPKRFQYNKDISDVTYNKDFIVIINMPTRELLVGETKSCFV